MPENINSMTKHLKFSYILTLRNLLLFFKLILLKGKFFDFPQGFIFLNVKLCSASLIRKLNFVNKNLYFMNCGSLK